MVFNATWSPGSDAVAGMQNKGLYFDQPVLAMYLDEGSLAIMSPGGPVMWPTFVRFLRQLRDGAEDMANFFDMRATMAPNPVGTPRPRREMHTVYWVSYEQDNAADVAEQIKKGARRRNNPQ